MTSAGNEYPWCLRFLISLQLIFTEKTCSSPFSDYMNPRKTPRASSLFAIIPSLWSQRVYGRLGEQHLPGGCGPHRKSHRETRNNEGFDMQKTTPLGGRAGCVDVRTSTTVLRTQTSFSFLWRRALACHHVEKKINAFRSTEDTFIPSSLVSDW